MSFSLEPFSPNRFLPTVTNIIAPPNYRNYEDDDISMIESFSSFSYSPVIYENQTTIYNNDIRLNKKKTTGYLHFHNYPENDFGNNSALYNNHQLFLNQNYLAIIYLWIPLEML